MSDKGIQVEEATSYAIARARARGAEEATADDLILGCLHSLSRFGVTEIGTWAIDLEKLGVDWLRPPEPGSSKVAYSADAVELFDRAARIAKLDQGGGAMRTVHLLVAADACQQGAMGELRKQYGITSLAWRAALAREDAEAPAEPRAAEAPPPTDREYLSPEEAAAELGVHVQTMRVYVRSGKIPALRIAGERAIRIRRADLSKVLEPLAPQS